MHNDRLLALLEAYLEDRLSAAEADELRAELRSSPAARRRFWEYVGQHALIEDVLSETRGRDLALVQEDSPQAPLTSNFSPPTGSEGPAGARRWGLLALLGGLTALAAGLLLAFTLWPRPGSSPDPVPESVPFATVHSLAGDVRVSDPSGQAVPAVPGSALATGHVLHVGDEESMAEVLFSDGTQVSLSPGSTLRLAGRPAKGKRIHLEAGSAHVQAAPQSAEHPLVVTTDHARITAQQTRFRLYREQKASRVEMEEGKAVLESQAGDRRVELAEGLYVVATDEPQPMVTQPLPVGHCRLRHTFLKAGDAACFSGDGTRLATSHFHRGMKAWGVQDGKLQASARGSGEWSAGLTFLPGDDTVIAAGNRGAVTLWKLAELQANTERIGEKELRCVALSPDGGWIAQGKKNEVVVWEANHRTGSITLRRSFPGKPSAVALSSVGPRVAISKWGGAIGVWDVASGRELAQHKLTRTPTPVCLSADGRFLAAYANEDGLVLFDLTEGVRRNLWPGEGARVGCLSFSPDGRVLLAGLADGTVRAWSAPQGQSLLILETGYNRVNKIAVAAESSLLATVGNSDCVKIWECKLP